MTNRDLPILYSFRRCPYAMRARMALQSSGQTCQLREILLKDKPSEMTDISPKGTVPVLQLPDGTVLEESLEVMHWALQQADPDQWLPANDEQNDNCRNLIAECDGPFKHHLDRYKYASRYEDCDPLEHRAQAETFLAKLDDILKGQDFLGGNKPGLADHAIFPFIRQFSIADPKWFKSSAYERVQKWLDVMINSEIFLTIMEKLPAWQREDAPTIRFVRK